MANHSSSHTHKLPFGAARLCQDLATLINNRQGSDIQFKVGGGTSTHRENGEIIYNESETVTIYAHSSILRCRSRYFTSMLDEDKHWKESTNGVIYKPNISPSTFQEILRYIYTGNIRAESPQTIIDLISAAEEMDLDELGAYCQIELIRIIKHIFSNEDNSGNEKLTKQKIPIDIVIRKYIIPALNLASSHSLLDLSRKLQAIVLPHMSMIIKSPKAYITFIDGISFDAFYKVITSDDLAITERNAWDLALGWGCHKMKLSTKTVEAQLSNLEYGENDGESSGGTVISSIQLFQLKTKIEPLLPAIRFSLLDHDDYQEIFDVLNYFLPRRQASELNRFFLNPDGTRPLDVPRMETPELQISSKITVKYSAWELLRKNIFKTGGISGCFSLNDLKFKLLFRASEHGFLAKAFHQHCDNKGPTLILTKSTSGYIFGGVNFSHWNSNNGFASSPLNFLFALPDGNHRKYWAIFRVNPDGAECTSFNHLDWGPVFVTDLAISDSTNAYTSFSGLPSIYNGNGASKTALAGAEKFLVSEYEVFAISS